jgi:hypothetical protein
MKRLLMAAALAGGVMSSWRKPMPPCWRGLMYNAISTNK